MIFVLLCQCKQRLTDEGFRMKKPMADKGDIMTLNEAELGKEYEIKELVLDGDEELESFLFTLGCYSGELITVVDKKKNLVVSIKDARYNIDPDLAEVIRI